MSPLRGCSNVGSAHHAMLLQPLVLGAVTGVASSVHCAAMCGPLAASACAKGTARTSLARYQVGRTAGYALAGAVAGGLGHVVALSAISPKLAYAVPAVTALSLLVLARRMLKGKSELIQLGTGVGRNKAGGLFAWLARYAPRDPSVLGALTALLPCAALGAALLLAASTQSRGAGATLMAGFSITSAIGVLGGGALLGRLTRLGGRAAPRVLATVLAGAALYIGLAPVYRDFLAPDAPAAHAPSCH